MEVKTAISTSNTGALPLAKRLKNFQDKSGASVADIAREIAYSRTTVSRYINGKYDSDPIELEAKLEKYLTKHTGVQNQVTVPVTKPAATKRPQFYGSRDAKAVLGVCQSCQEFVGMGLVVGRSGYGKTHTLREYAKLPRVAYVECDDTMSSRDLVEAIEEALGIPSGYGTIWRRTKGIRHFFDINQGYLLIIDEADKLISKYTQKKMEVLRAIFDKSSVGIVMAGEPKLEAQVKGYLERMANRVEFYARLNGLAPSEVEGFLNGFDIADDAMLELKARACNSQTGCFRLLDRTLSNVFRILKDEGSGVITLKMIEQASSMMML
ncbi:MAG TPA: AAA family ATPase [Clostridia bacterium]|nr:AAA family ATPase [Clostridia bacterium]